MRIVYFTIKCDSDELIGVLYLSRVHPAERQSHNGLQSDLQVIQGM
jgi:hypothetical protein